MKDWGETQIDLRVKGEREKGSKQDMLQCSAFHLNRICLRDFLSSARQRQISEMSPPSPPEMNEFQQPEKKRGTRLERNRACATTLS